MFYNLFVVLNRFTKSFVPYPTKKSKGMFIVKYINVINPPYRISLYSELSTDSENILTMKYVPVNDNINII